MTKTGLDLLKNDDIIDYASKVGYTVYSYPGEFAFRWLQIAYITRCLTVNSDTRYKFHFDDNPYMRARLHILLYWDRGCVKTSMIKYFFDYCTHAIRVGDRKGRRKDYYTWTTPKLLDLTGRFSYERLTGGIRSDGSVIAPFFTVADFCVAGELMQFMGEDQREQLDRMNFLNEMLESGEGTTSLLKFEKFDESLEQNKEILEKFHIHVDKILGMMNFKAPGIFFFATRQLTSKTKKAFDVGGFFDRNIVLHWDKINDEKLPFYMHTSPLPNESGEKVLLEANTMLWKTELETLNAPPRELMDKGKEVMIEYYQKLSAEYELPLQNLLTKRDESTIATLLACSAYLRLFKELAPRTKFKRLQYSEKDLDNIKKLLEEIANIKISSFKKQNTSYKSNIYSVRKKLTQKFPRKKKLPIIDVVKFIEKNYSGVSQKTARNWLDKMNDMNLLEFITTGKYKKYLILK